MIAPNKTENPVANLLKGFALIIFGSIALFVAWILTKADVHWFLLFCMIVSFVIPALGAFWLGVKQLEAFMKKDRSSH